MPRKILPITFVFLSLCMPIFHVNAQNAVPTHLVDGTVIREWLVLGPFLGEGPVDLETDFLADVGGEAFIDPKEGDVVSTADGKTLTWNRYTAEGQVVDLVDAVAERGRNLIAYAFCHLESEAPTDAQIHIRGDDRVSVWVNGRREYHR